MRAQEEEEEGPRKETSLELAELLSEIKRHEDRSVPSRAAAGRLILRLQHSHTPAAVTKCTATKNTDVHRAGSDSSISTARLLCFIDVEIS